MPLPFSIIVPIYASGLPGVADLEACLRGVRASRGGEDAELIVVDDASPMAEAICSVAQRYHARVERLGETSGPAAARNRGAKSTHQQILVFLDADTVPHNDTLMRFHQAFQADPELAAVFGSYDDTPSDPHLVSRFRNLLHHWVHHQSRRKASTFWAGCGAVQRSAYFTIGGFDQSYTGPSIEDVAFGMSLTSAGFRVELHPEIQVTHLKRWTLGSALRTDLRDRAIPWTVALWAGASLPNDLNFTWKHKASVVLSVVLWTAWIVSIWLSVGAAALLLFLNLPFYRFLWSRGGLTLAATGYGAHSLHYSVSALGFALGTLKAIPLLGLLPLLVVAVQWSTGAYTADWGEFPDESAHAVTGIMVSEWMRRPTLDVLGFAERYYVFYPVLGIGHWPPLFYALSAAWVYLFGPSRGAALLLIAILATLLLATVYLFLRRRSTPVAAMTATGLILLNTHFVDALSLVMLDLCTALAVLVGVWCWAQYMDRPSTKQAVAFGLAASACLLLKQTALVLIPLPLLAIALTRRWSLIARPHFWLPAVIVLPIAGPWHWYTLQNVYSNAGEWGGLGGGTSNWALPFASTGWALSVAGIAGVATLFRGKADSLLFSCAALVAGCFLCIPLVGALREPRHMLLILPPLALLAAPVLSRKWGLAAVLLLALDLHWTHRPPAQYRPLVARLNRISPGPVLLTANDFSETRMIAAIASESPTPQRQWLRGSKLLADVSWNGRVRTETFSSGSQMEDALVQADVSGVLIITKAGHAPLSYHQNLSSALSSRPTAWRRTALSSEAVLYERTTRSSEPLRAVPFFVPRLRRTLGGS